MCCLLSIQWYAIPVSMIDGEHMKILIQTVIQVGGTSVFPCFVALQILLTITVSVIQKCI